MAFMRALYGPSPDPSKIQCLETLEDRCFYYIIHHLSEFPPGSLCLLPLTIRRKLLLNLPAVDIWRLEADGVTEGLDEESLWKFLINERYQHVSQEHFRPPFFHKMPSRDLFFTFVWHHTLHPDFFDRSLSRLLYSVPCVLGVNGLLISELNYQPSQYILKEVIKNDPIVQNVDSHRHQRYNRVLRRDVEFLATMRYFSEVCRIRPKYFFCHCVNIGKHTLMSTNTQLTRFLQSFMENLEQIRFDGCGSLDSLERIYHEAEDQSLKRLFLRIPRIFLDAAISNPCCNLKSIEIDADDGQRVSNLLASVQSALSVGYSKVEVLSLKFDSRRYQYRPTYIRHLSNLLSDIKKLINTQPHLYSIDISIPEEIPSIGDDVETVERYAELVTAIEKYVHRPYFKYLILRNLLTFEGVKQIIHTFLSLPQSSDPQLLDVRAFNDITSQPDTILEGPGKFLMISGSCTDDDREENLTPTVFQMLCNTSVYHFEVVDNLSGIVSALKQPIESLKVENLFLTICKATPTWLQYKKYWPENRHFASRSLPYYGGYHPRSNRKQDGEAKGTEFQGIDRLISNPSLLALNIRFHSADDYVSSSQVSSFLSAISDGLKIQSCNLRLLSLPKLDYALRNDDKLRHFFHCVFSLPHVEELELSLTFVKFTIRYAKIIRLCHCESGGTVLAKFSLHCDSIGNVHESSESLRVVLKDVCKDLTCTVRAEV